MAEHHQLKRPVPSDELLRWFSQSYGSYSTAQISAAMSYMFGAMMATARMISPIRNWSLCSEIPGRNADERRWCHLLRRASPRRSNARMIVIDPRYNDTAAGLKMNGCPFALAPMAHWPVRLLGTDY